MKKIGLFFSVLCCLMTSLSFAQGNSYPDQGRPQDMYMAQGHDGDTRDWPQDHPASPEEQSCAPIEKPAGDCYCLYCKYVPCYYNKWHCEYVPEYGCKKCCRMVDECYTKRCCRMVPQYYDKTCTRKVPQYYYERTCRQVPKYSCEKCCKWKKEYYYKHTCAPTCTQDTCVEQR